MWAIVIGLNWVEFKTLAILNMKKHYPQIAQIWQIFVLVRNKPNIFEPRRHEDTEKNKGKTL